MLNRRLWILFIAFLIGFLALGAQLCRLQISNAELWHDRMQQLIHREDPIESYRGKIVDRHGVEMAVDVPSDELAIDFRAMNLDNNWLDRAAINQMKKNGEWSRFDSRQQRTARKEEVKAEIAEQISGMPARIARALAPFEQTTPELLEAEIIKRRNDINERVAILRQNVFLSQYVRNAARNSGDSTSSTGQNSADIDDSNLDTLFRQLKLTDEVASHTLRANLAPAAALYFKQHLAEFPGLVVRDAAEYNRRDYPFGEATAHIIGTLRSVTPETFNANRFKLPDLLSKTEGNLAGYLPGDRLGATGVEAAAEGLLHGVRGVRMVDLSEASSQPAETERIEPAPGKSVKLTVDALLQRDIYDALRDPSKSHSRQDLLKGTDGKDHPAAMVIMSIDGQVLALISYPSYDPNKIDVLRAALNADVARNPQINRATSGIYPPGSTVKPLLALAALNERIVTVDETIHCAGRLFPNRFDIFKCDGIHSDISLIPAIEKSCDIYFYTVGQRLGINRITQWYGMLGFGRDTGLELPDNAGRLPRISDEDDRNLDDARRLGIGQGPIAVTPLQMANAYATMLRKGVAIPPRILEGSPAPQTQAYPVSDAMLGVARAGMERVVTSGTAREAFSGFKLRVAGKTGTAEHPGAVFDDQGKPVDDTTRPLLNPDKTPKLKADGTPAYAQLVETNDDAWFVGYAPADNPRFIVAAVMEWGGHGGARAAPMVHEAFVQLQRHNYLPRTDVP